jgi:hypothetical protein
MLMNKMQEPPSKTAEALLQAIRGLAREERLWLLKQVIRQLLPKDLDASEASEVPSTAYAKELVAYFDSLPDDERAVIDELARRDSAHGGEPTPGL